MSAGEGSSVQCWCGNADLEPFSDDYLHCTRCETLVNARSTCAADFEVSESDQGIYGREYYTVTLPGKYGFPSIQERARQDLTERCLHWLETIIRYRTPPASVLELGSAHGGFVGLLQLAGYRATGLELSPWLVNFARETFGVPMLTGPIEQQTVEPASLDVIAMMDVIEHLPNPVQTIKRCVELLKPDGLLVIQTPRYPAGTSYAMMLERKDSFLEQLRPEQHLFLFSPASIAAFLGGLGLSHVRFETAIFDFYDMYLVASRMPITSINEGRVSGLLSESPNRRFALAMLDLRRREVALKETLDRETTALRQRIGEIEGDREARLQVILEQQSENAVLRQRIGEIEADREARLKVILEEQSENAALRQRIGEIEADREARLKVILDQQSENTVLRQRIDEIEAASLDRVERSACSIEELKGEIARLQTVRGAVRVLLKPTRNV